jgi:hypothetical protein
MLPLSSSSLTSRPLTEDCRQRFGKVAVAVHVFVDWLEFLTDAAQNFLIGKKPLQQLLPVRNRAVFQHQLQRDVLEKKVFGRLNHAGQTHLLVFGHPSSSETERPNQWLGSLHSTAERAYFKLCNFDCAIDSASLFGFSFTICS